METDSNFDIKRPKDAWMHQDAYHIVFGTKPLVFSGIIAIPLTVTVFGILSWMFSTPNITIEGKWMQWISILIGSFFTIGLILIGILEKIEIAVDYSTAKIFRGIGKFGKTQSLFLENISEVKEEKSRDDNGKILCHIVLEGKERMTFGTTLGEEKRRYLLQVMQQILHNKKNNKNFLKQDLSKHLIQR